MVVSALYTSNIYISSFWGWGERLILNTHIFIYTTSLFRVDMGRNVYSKVKEMLDNYKGDEITFGDLIGLITIKIGSVQSTINTAMKTMQYAGMLKDIGNSRFKVIRK